MAYATTDELAAALRISATAANEASLQACLDAAAVEIDDACDRLTPLEPDDPLANRVNLVRAVEWWKANDAAFGIIGSAETGVLRVPRNSFLRHQLTLMPRKEQWGVA